MEHYECGFADDSGYVFVFKVEIKDLVLLVELILLNCSYESYFVTYSFQCWDAGLC